MKIRVYFALLAAVSALAFPCLAPAQTATSSATAAPEAATAESLNEIVVTGSRVITNGNDSPNPVTVVRPQELSQIAPTSLIDALNDLPVFSGSRSQYSSAVGAGTAGGGNPAANELNLRNLGANRDLILFDGQRVPPTVVLGVVDVDMIPQMLIQRVDTVTGGVSAVYGSDAISGVVNFVTNKNFNGVKVEGQAGVSQYDDDRTNRFGFAGGTKVLDGRAHIEGSFEHYEDDGIPSRLDRPWATQWAIEGAGTAAAPYQLVDNARLAKYSFGGLITNGVLAGQTFANNGVLSPFVNGAPTGSSCCQSGGGGAYFDTSLKAPLTTNQLFGRFDYDFAQNMHGHVEVTANFKTDSQNGIYDQISATISSQNAFLPTAYQAALAAAHQSTFNLNEMIQQDQLVSRASEQQYFVNTGLNGKFADYDWSVDGNFGAATLNNTQHDNPDTQNLAAALDAVVNPSNGQIVCHVTLTNPGADPGCVPLNPFGPSAASAAALKYIVNDTHFTAQTRSYDLVGQISGEPLRSWAGPVKIALSAEWRRLTYEASTDAPPTVDPDCTGLAHNCSASTPQWGEEFSDRSPVSQTVAEGAAEFDAPLLKDLPLVQLLSLNGAGRYTDYDTSGAYWTWKLGLDWHVNDDLTIRATTSRDIRAPTLNDLYLPLTVGTVSSQDLLTGANPVVEQYSVGNPNLKAEIGHTSTVGFILRPSVLPGFSLSLDGYYIDVTNAITRVQGFTPSIQQICYASGGTSPYCQLQSRPLGFTNTSLANAVTAWYSEEINIAEIETYGADLEANYVGQILDHNFALRGFTTYQPHIIYRQPGTTTIDMGGVAYGPAPLVASPSLRVTLLGRFDVTRNLSVDVTERWRNSMKESGDPTQIWINNHVASVAYTDLNISYKFDAGHVRTELFLNIGNLFNTSPPPAAVYGSGTSPGQTGSYSIGDDPIGRYFTMGARIDF